MAAAVLTLAQVPADAYQSPQLWSYVLSGWGIIAVLFVAYGASLLWRGRRLARQVPPEDRRWMS
jgi:hypothetical protein